MSISQQNERVFRMSMGSGHVDPWSVNHLGTSGTNYLTARAPAGGAAAPGAGGGGSARVDASRKEMYGLARDDVSRAKGDPVDAAIRAKLMGRMNGQDVPYNEATTNAMFSRQSDMAAATERALAGRIRGNPTDPSFQAKLGQLHGDRAGAVQGARLAIDEKANLANYDAQSGAIRDLGSHNAGYNDRITNASRNLQGHLSREYADDSAPGGAGGAGGARGSVQMILPRGPHNPSTLPSAADAFGNDSGYDPYGKGGTVIQGTPSRVQATANRTPSAQPGTSSGFGGWGNLAAKAFPGLGSFMTAFGNGFKG